MLINSKTTFIIIFILFCFLNNQAYSQTITNISCLNCTKSCAGGIKCLVYYSSLALDETCLGSDTCPSEYANNTKISKYTDSCSLSGCSTSCCIRSNNLDFSDQVCFDISDLKSSQYCYGLSSGGIAGILIGSIWGFFIVLGIIVCVCIKFRSKKQEKDAQSQNLVGQQKKNQEQIKGIIKATQ